MRRRVSQRKVDNRLVRTKRRVSKKNKSRTKRRITVRTKVRTNRRVSKNRTKRMSKVRNKRNTRNTKKYRQRGAGPAALSLPGKHSRTNHIRGAPRAQRVKQYAAAMEAAKNEYEGKLTVSSETQALINKSPTEKTPQTEQKIGTDKPTGLFSKCFGRPKKNN